MNTARVAWAAEYREARKLARFIETFYDELSALPVAERTFPQCRGFEFSRLSGDSLRWVGEGLFAPSAECHRSRLACLRYQSPRLPA
ncbi:hypothetical protein D7Y24_02635 [Stenotrophomonas maltophilia]|uniref:hypothetical protein n=1 Tax=Stenotrophomonas maltophilia TaxID=40324 RepID=UPI0015DF4DBE|nr:hypothetical protein [Stenotrophomonas maltophilia]MBA0297324.1 hypothetical protein [Stenotrophomonas maltophilia]